jgi:hypothetical protein
MAKNRGLAMIAITDHDTVSGIKEGRQRASEVGLEFVAGIEISTQDTEEVHILGYQIDEENEELRACCEKYEADRLNRGQRICEYFIRRNIPMPLEEIQVIAGGGSMGRPHFARWLQEHGYVSDRKEAFDKYLDTKEFHQETDREKPSPEEAIRLIHEAGGSAVLAHPGLLRMSLEEQESFVEILKNAGLDGIECFYSKHSWEQIQVYLNLAEKNNLKISCGSDFHGEQIKPDVSLGMKMEDGYADRFVVKKSE